ncbi:MAG: hypothetical protein ABIQ49_11770 [Gemmatimonadales bacterium]
MNSSEWSPPLLPAETAAGALTEKRSSAWVVVRWPIVPQRVPVAATTTKADALCAVFETSKPTARAAEVSPGSSGP